MLNSQYSQCVCELMCKGCTCWAGASQLCQTDGVPTDAQRRGAASRSLWWGGSAEPPSPPKLHWCWHERGDSSVRLGGGIQLPFWGLFPTRVPSGHIAAVTSACRCSPGKLWHQGDASSLNASGSCRHRRVAMGKEGAGLNCWRSAAEVLPLPGTPRQAFVAWVPPAREGRTHPS